MPLLLTATVLLLGLRHVAADSNPPIQNYNGYYYPPTSTESEQRIGRHAAPTGYNHVPLSTRTNDYYGMSLTAARGVSQ